MCLLGVVVRRLRGAAPLLTVTHAHRIRGAPGASDPTEAPGRGSATLHGCRAAALLRVGAASGSYLDGTGRSRRRSLKLRMRNQVVAEPKRRALAPWRTRVDCARLVFTERGDCSHVPRASCCIARVVGDASRTVVSWELRQSYCARQRNRPRAGYLTPVRRFLLPHKSHLLLCSSSSPSTSPCRLGRR